MRKFILIDQSIKDAGGHHLEYALRVLKAAKNLGFESVLATHKDCGSVTSEHIDVVDRAFSYTFWENFQSEFLALSPKERRFLNFVKTKKDELLYGLLGSSIGFSYMAAAHGLRLPELFARYGTSTAGKRLSSVTILAGYVLVRVNHVAHVVSRKLSRLSRLGRRIARWGALGLAGVIGLALSPVLLPYLLIRWRRMVSKSDTYVSRFAEDIKRLLVRVKASSGDVVFIPTLGNVELIGSGICAEGFPVEGLSWHFLFRRNLFKGREPSYQLQMDKQLKTLQALSSYKRQAPAEASAFYTDTDALTEQYSRLGAFKFKTLPIPLDESLGKTASEDRRVNIVYIGDARDEKGFSMLPRLVADLRAAGYTQDDVRFTFQSNFNVPGGEPGSRIAKAELAAESADQVRLVEGPFESAEYTDIVNDADIILVPYDAENYYARSSGVFVEALVAGIPIVASDKSWMSQEMLILNQEYYRDLLAGREVLQTVAFDATKGKSKLALSPKVCDGACWLMVEVNQLFEKPGQYMHIRWSADPPIVLRSDRSASFFRQVTVDLRMAQSFALLRVPYCDKITLTFEIDDGRGNVSQLHKAESAALAVAVHELRMDAAEPQYQACTFFSQEGDFSTAIIEIIERRDQYEGHSRRLSENWRAYHNSERLVEFLAEDNL